MKRSMQWTAELLLLGAIVALGWLLLAPRAPRQLPEPAAAAEQPAEAAGPVSLESPPRRAAAPQIAALLGWRAPVETPAPVKQPQPPARPDWLKFLGYVVEADGLPSYAFKDLRSGNVFSLRLGQASKGWRLLEARGREFLLEFDGARYLIGGGE